MQRASMADPVLVSDDGALRVIRFNRPEKKNALTQPMYAAITRALREAQTSGAIRCVVLTGGHAVF
jgi:enoyl-CoA hydratase/carnithine racemase